MTPVAIASDVPTPLKRYHAADLAAKHGPGAQLPPALAYLARLASPVGRRNMAWALDVAARLLSGDVADLATYPWAAMTPAHFAGLRSLLLAKGYGAHTVNTTWRASGALYGNAGGRA